MFLMTSQFCSSNGIVSGELRQDFDQFSQFLVGQRGFFL